MKTWRDKFRPVIAVLIEKQKWQGNKTDVKKALYAEAKRLGVSEGYLGGIWRSEVNSQLKIRRNSDNPAPLFEGQTNERA